MMETNNKTIITSAENFEANEIANLIMMAMNHDCCMNFTGKHRSLPLFKTVMVKLINSEKSQYSKENILVATDENGNLMGILVCYDGAKLLELRKSFILLASKYFDTDWSNMDEETQKGELYLDSLAVKSEYRGRGIASKLIIEAFHKAKQMNINCVGLLVDANNPKAERLYKKLGFEYKNATTWGGHAMKHLQINV